MRVLAVVGWKEYQHYKKRDPIWIKLYQKTLTTEVWVLGTDVSRLVQLASTLLAARYDNQIPMKWDLIRKVAHFGFTETEFDAAIAHLIAFDFLEIQEVDDPIKVFASKPLATCDTTSPTMLAQSRGRVETETDQECVNASAMLATGEREATGGDGISPAIELGGTDPPRARAISVLQTPNGARKTFLAVQDAYPAGMHRGDHWGNADHHLQRLVEQGTPPEALVQAARDYGAQQSALGKIGTDAVMRPNNFFGTAAWKGPFPLPRTGPADKHAAERDQRLTREAAELQALVEGRAVRGLLDYREPGEHESADAYRTALRLEEQDRRARPAGDVGGVVADLAAQKRVAK